MFIPKPWLTEYIGSIFTGFVLDTSLEDKPVRNENVSVVTKLDKKLIALNTILICTVTAKALDKTRGLLQLIEIYSYVDC